jgi:hypothetical protein
MTRIESAKRAALATFCATVLLLVPGCRKTVNLGNHGYPDASETPSWTRTGEIRTFAPGNLSDYIDGDAEKYIKAGVESTTTADYKAKNQTQVVADIYTMASPAGAKTVFESDPASNAKSADVGDASRLFKQSLTFRRGEYFVQIVAYQESPQLDQELIELGKAIDRKLIH